MQLEDIYEVLDNKVVQVCLTVAVIALLQIIIRTTIGRIVGRVVRSHRYQNVSEARKREKTLTGVFRTLSAVVLWAVGFFIILSQLDINLAALITGAGFLGVIIGFGAQNAIKDFIAGMFIIAENQYRIGDIVKLQASGTETAGVVEDIGVRITKLRDLDGRLHIIPNGSIELVSNMTFSFANVNIDVGVSYDSDIDKVESTMNEVGKALAKDRKWGDKIVEPISFLRVDSFGDSAVVIKALGKVKAGSQWEVAGEYRRQLKKAFEKNGITIPFPQVVVHKD